MTGDDAKCEEEDGRQAAEFEARAAGVRAETERLCAVGVRREACKAGREAGCLRRGGGSLPCGVSCWRCRRPASAEQTLSSSTQLTWMKQAADLWHPTDLQYHTAELHQHTANPVLACSPTRRCGRRLSGCGASPARCWLRGPRGRRRWRIRRSSSSCWTTCRCGLGRVCVVCCECGGRGSLDSDAGATLALGRRLRPGSTRAWNGAPAARAAARQLDSLAGRAAEKADGCAQGKGGRVALQQGGLVLKPVCW